MQVFLITWLFAVSNLFFDLLSLGIRMEIPILAGVQK